MTSLRGGHTHITLQTKAISRNYRKILMVTTSIFQLVSFVFIGTKFFFMKYVATIITDQYDILLRNRTIYL